MSGSYPLYTPVVNFQNNSGTLIAPSSMRFVDFYKNNLTFAMQNDSDYFYVWSASANSKKPVCEGRLLNDSGASVTSQQLSHVVVGDFDGSGQLSVFGVHTDASWYYVWKLGANVGSTTHACNGIYSFRPVASGQLLDGNNRPLVGNNLKFVLPTDWDNNETNEITAFVRGTNNSLVWKVGQRPATVTSISLNSLKVDGITSIVDSRGSAGSILSTSKNVPMGTELYLKTAGAVQRMRNMAIDLTMNDCSSIPGLCKNTQILLSLDQAFPDGPINAYRMPKDPNSWGVNLGMNRVAVDRLLAQIAIIKTKLNAKGVTLTVIVNPAHADKENLVKVLDALDKLGIPFVFDMIASDTRSSYLQNYWKKTSFVSKVSDKKILYGLSLDLSITDQNNKEGLKYYVKRYPNTLKGYRIFEQLGLAQLHVLCQNWAATEPKSSRYLNRCYDYEGTDEVHQALNKTLSAPYRDTDWQADVVGNSSKKGLIKQAHEEGKYVLWFDAHEFDPFQYYHQNTYYTIELYNKMEAERIAYIAYKKSLVNAYPNTVVPIYDNNEGTKLTPIPGFKHLQETPRNFRLSNWTQAPNYYSSSIGSGLSNQSWTSDATLFWNSAYLPPDELAVWSVTALNNATKGSKWIEMEPLWYFFHWVPTQGTEIQPTTASNSCIGLPTENLNKQLALFGVGPVQTCTQ